MVRFDFFIHRQAAYLRALEASLHQNGLAVPLWESWKASLQSTRIVIPVADVFATLITMIITAYMLFGPAKKIFRSRDWPAHRIYSWLILLLQRGEWVFPIQISFSTYGLPAGNWLGSTDKGLIVSAPVVAAPHPDSLLG
jgi:hypothetical protein